MYISAPFCEQLKFHNVCTTFKEIYFQYILQQIFYLSISFYIHNYSTHIHNYSAFLFFIHDYFTNIHNYSAIISFIKIKKHFFIF